MVVEIEEDGCIACGQCEEVCPVDAITVEDVAVVDEDACIDCGNCVDSCPVDVITL